jgi:hypothetical protein
MQQSELMKEIVNTYRKHGWEWRRVLLRPETKDDLNMAFEANELELIQIEDGDVDALWFSRASHAEREAWELRLLAETPFALFETFERDETEEQREEMRREMEALLKDRTKK